jgi:hypothetical protein
MRTIFSMGKTASQRSRSVMFLFFPEGIVARSQVKHIGARKTRLARGLHVVDYEHGS